MALWDDETGRYVLLQTVKGSRDPDTCLVYDLETGTALLEEEDEVYHEIVTRLAQKGALMIDELPPTGEGE